MRVSTKTSPPKFKIGFKDKPEDVKRSVEQLFESVKEELVDDGVFDENEKIVIDANSVAYVVGQLEQFSLMKTDKDTVGDAFEIFAESKYVAKRESSSRLEKSSKCVWI